jgi:hypothetical protein
MRWLYSLPEQLLASQEEIFFTGKDSVIFFNASFTSTSTIRSSCYASMAFWPVFGMWPPRCRCSRHSNFYEVRMSTVRSTPNLEGQGISVRHLATPLKTCPAQGRHYQQLDCRQQSFPSSVVHASSVTRLNIPSSGWRYYRESQCLYMCDNY